MIPRPRVLVVDPDPLMRSKFDLYLADVAEVCHERTGQAALHRFPLEQFDIALISVSLPDMSGVALCAALSLIQPNMHRLLMFENQEIEEFDESLERTGAAGILLKPVAAEAMLIELERAEASVA
jgi:DNA-binding NarL/FixJ family response regulator